MYGLKCFTADAMDNASISQGSHVVCHPRNFALKNPASFNLPARITYKVAPNPYCLVEPSVTSHSLSEGRGNMIALFVCRLSCACLKAFRNESVQTMCSEDWRPPVALSKDASKAEQPGINRAWPSQSWELHSWLG